MRIWVMAGILAACIVVVVFCALIFLPGLNHDIFSDANALDQGWPPFLQFVMKGWWYIVIGLLLGAIIVVFRSVKTGGGGGPV